MARVFVSHAGEDGEPAAMVHRWLLDDGHDVFLDQDLRDGIGLGEEWERRLHERLRWADAVVCVVTSAYTTSVWCTAEVVIARSRGSRLLPVLAEPAAAHPLLKSLQHVDATKDAGKARVMLAEALLRIDAVGGTGWPDGRSPFPGLRSFDMDQHRVYFGREGDVEQLAALLRSPAERAEGSALVVVGPSGCGKSSLVRAGLLPVMAGEPEWWTLSPFTPGTDPVARLIRELAAAARGVGIDWPMSDVRDRLERHGLAELADELLLAVPGRRRRRLLVVVDQFEELLTQSAGPERARFADLLRPALAGSVQLVVTLRPEFLEPLLVSPELDALPKRIHTVGPLRREALRGVIEKPAQLAGIDVDEDLVERLVADTDSGEALPLLAYTLAELAAGITRGGRLLTTRYEQLGGVQGALTRQADAALADAMATNGRSREKVIRELLRLVTVDEHGRPTRWRVPRDELPEPVARALDAFVARRLLTTDSESGGAVIGVAHEAFLSSWSPLAEAIAAASSALRARRAVEQAADQWAEGGSPSRLWERGQLAAAVLDTGARVERSRGSGDEPPAARHAWWSVRGPSIVVTDRVELSARARDFLRASIRRDRRRRGRSTTVLSALLVLALGATAVAFTQQRAAVDQQKVALARQLVAQSDTARDGDPRTALLLGIAAQRIHPDGQTRSSLVDTLTHTRYSRTLGHRDAVVSVAFTRDGRTLATGGIDGTVVLWDLTDPTRPTRMGEPLTGHTRYVYSVDFAPDGRTLASAGDDHTVILWDVADPARPRRLGEPLGGHTEAVHSAAFAPDGRTLVTAGFDRTVILWDVTDPARPRRLGDPLTGHTDRVTTAAFAPGGRTVATAGFDNTVILWDVADPARPRRLGAPLAGHTTAIWSVSFAPDGATLATAGADTVILWDVADPARPQRLGEPLTGHSSGVYSAAFSADGRMLATAGADGRVVLWDLADPARARRVGQSLTGHTGAVYSVAFASDGRTVASGSADTTAIVWDLADPAQPQRLGEPLIGHTSATWSVAIAPDGRGLAAGGADGTVIGWDLADPARPRRLEPFLDGHAGGVHSVAYSPRGPPVVATAGADGRVVLWDLADPTRPRPLGEPLTGHPAAPGSVSAVYSLAFAPDGRTLATAGADSTVVRWDVTDPIRPRPLGPPLTGHTSAVYAVAFSPDGRTLATAGADTSVILWNVADPPAPRRLGVALTGHADVVYSVAFAPDGRTLSSAGADDAVVLWDVADPAAPRRLGQPLVGHSSDVYSVAFAPDGRTLATASADSAVVLWDVVDPARPRRLGQPLIGHRGPVHSVAFGPDGRALATAGGDGTVVRWDVAGLPDLRDGAAERACSITGRGLDRAEWARYIPGLEYEDTCAG